MILVFTNGLGRLLDTRRNPSAFVSVVLQQLLEPLFQVPRLGLQLGDFVIPCPAGRHDGLVDPIQRGVNNPNATNKCQRGQETKEAVAQALGTSARQGLFVGLVQVKAVHEVHLFHLDLSSRHGGQGEARLDKVVYPIKVVELVS